MECLLKVKDVMDLLGVKETKARQIIRELNSKLSEEGYFTIRGKVPTNYLKKMYHI